MLLCFGVSKRFCHKKVQMNQISYTLHFGHHHLNASYAMKNIEIGYIVGIGGYEDIIR